MFLSIGIRHDTYEQTTRGASGPGTKADALSYSAGLLYKFDSGIAPYVSYATSFEPLAPDRFGFFYDPIDGEQIEAGIKYQIPGTPTLFTASVFEITQQNRQQPNPDFGPGRPAFVQTGETRIRGLELDAQAAFYDFEVLASYTRLETEDKATGFALASVPEHLASAWLNYRPKAGPWAGFVAGLGVRHVGESFDGADKFVTPSYTLFDAQIGYETETYSAKFNVQNIADDVYLTTCLSRGDCFFGERRTVSFRLAAKF